MGGATVKLPHTHIIAGKWRWIAPPWARRIGARSETLCPAPRLTEDAIDRSRDLTAFWSAARAEDRKPREYAAAGTVTWLVEQYRRSSWYAELKPRTREAVDLACRDIVTALGKQMVRNLRRRHCRLFLEGSLPDGQEVTRKRIKTLVRVLNYGIELDLRDSNPAAKMGIKGSPGRKHVWTEAEVDLCAAGAIDIGEWNTALAIWLAYDSSQRLGDLITLKWDQFDGEGIDWDPAKVEDSETWTPLCEVSLMLLANTSKRGVQVLVSDRTGRAYSPRNGRVAFNRSFKRAAAMGGIRRDLQFRDLRRTAATEILAGGGRSEPITGHKPGSKVIRIYERPNKDAARKAQSVRPKRGTKV